ncbi:hypothetical protein FHX37_1774 [Haloactinospora alba]|uniref:Uncharacterized protein n=1 Tax=Haloactinospora alba TaxID=405555 RepID=A0A543NJ25_9ACTN|nr:hypothetical protein FHX37_1774 [Haloactinospora alba]
MSPLALFGTAALGMCGLLVVLFVVTLFSGADTAPEDATEEEDPPGGYPESAARPSQESSPPMLACTVQQTWDNARGDTSDDGRGDTDVHRPTQGADS